MRATPRSAVIAEPRLFAWPPGRVRRILWGSRSGRLVPPTRRTCRGRRTCRALRGFPAAVSTPRPASTPPAASTRRAASTDRRTSTHRRASTRQTPSPGQRPVLPRLRSGWTCGGWAGWNKRLAVPAVPPRVHWIPRQADGAELGNRGLPGPDRGGGRHRARGHTGGSLLAGRPLMYRPLMHRPLIRRRMKNPEV